MQKFSVIILAGNRKETDSLSKTEGVDHKCLIDVAGRPIIDWVLEGVEDSGFAANVSICLAPASPLASAENLSRRIEDGRMDVIPAEESPARSILTAAEVI